MLRDACIHLGLRGLGVRFAWGDTLVNLTDIDM